MKHTEYRENNKEKIKEYRENNLDKIKEHYKANKEKINAKTKAYYDNNKQKLLEMMQKKVKCECGCEVSNQHVKRHQRTKKHIDLMKNKI